MTDCENPKRAWLHAISRYPEIRASLMLFVFSSLVYLAAFGFTWSGLNAYTQQQARHALARRAATEAITADQLAAAYDHARKTLPEIEARLRRPIHQSNLAVQATKLAKQSGVLIQNQAYENPKHVQDHFELQHEVVIQGQYRNVYRFIRGLESWNTWTTVRAMRIERTGKQHLVRADLKLLTTAYTSSGSQGR